MAEPAAKLMTSDEFLSWQEHQEDPYELIDGRPRLMTGATRRHDRVVVNAIAAFHARLRGGPCRPMTDDIAVPTSSMSVRRPDLTIDCGTYDGKAVKTAEPILVLEVLSPATIAVDRFVKLEEYKRLPTLRHILIADAGKAHVLAYARGEDGAWSSVNYIGMDSSIPLAAIGCSLTLAELYEDVPLANDGL